MDKNKRRLIYVISWATALAILLVLALWDFGYEDQYDLTLAIMMLVVPVAVMLLDMLHFFKFEKYYTTFKFIAINFLIVFGACFIIDSVVILVVFGILQPQVKLFLMAAIFSLVAAVLNLFQSCFLPLVMKEKKKR